MLQITNLTKTKIDEKLMQKVAQAAFAVLPASPNPAAVGEGGGNKKEVSLVLVGDAKIRSINKKYRHKNRVTDVLSFEKLDEIFICLPQATRQAKLLKTPLKTELTRLLVHGIVHLKGYDHEKSAKEAERMFAVEEKILKNL